MSMTLPLPASLKGRLAGLAGRIRFLAGVRGVSLLVLALTLVAGGAMLADFLAGYALPSGVRYALLAVWAALGALTFLRCLLVPVTRRLGSADLAAAVEEQYPQLGERLLTTVELADEERLASPALAGVLVREAEARSSGLDFQRAADGRSAARLAVVAVVALLLFFAPAALFPRAFGSLTRRFFLPWITPEAEPDFTFRPDPQGDRFAANGRPLEFAVTLVPRDERVALPPFVTLVMIVEGQETRHRLAPSEHAPSLFRGAIRISGNATCHYEAGNSTGDAFSIQAVAPIELAPDSPTITIVPPEYARVTMETETVRGLGELAALIHSEIRFSFSTTRTPAAAWIEWTPASAGAKPQRIAIVEGKGALKASEPGAYRVVLEAEHGIRTELEGGKLVLRPDQPPALLKISGAMDARKVRPHDRLTLETRLADDIALADAHLLWKRNSDDKESEEPFKLDGAGQREAVARHLFSLTRKARAGDVVSYRIRFRDNRPRQYGGPHTVYHPEKGWLTLDVVDQGQSPREEEITARREALAARIDEVRAALKQEMRASDKVRAETRAEEHLTPGQREQVQRVQKLNEEVRKQLEGLALLADREPETAVLGDKARQVRDEEMKKAGEALAQTLLKDAKPDTREKKFREAEQEFHQALNKLDDLKADNDRLARDRIDQARIEDLAQKQKQLADKAAELKNDPEAEKKAEALRREQEKAEQELKALAAGSDLLRKAADEARAAQARKEAEQAAELAKAQREVAGASAETEKKRQGERLAELARKQDELAARAEKLARETARALEADRSKPLKPVDARKAAASLGKGEADRAMIEQDRAARDLDKLARALDRLAQMKKDPREAARQLAILEENLARRTRESPALSDEKKQELSREQKAIREALAELSTPPSRKDIAAAKKKAGEALAEAEQELARGDKQAAAQKMEEARTAMRRLASKMPTAQERKREARGELQRLRTQQEELARSLEEARKPGAPAKRMEEVRRKQEALASQLGKLDAPGLEARRDLARKEMARAAEEMERKNPDDARISQKRAQRALDRLAEAMAGHKPEDEKAKELAQTQRELLAQMEKADADKETPKWKKEEAKWKQRQIAEAARKLNAPDAPAAKREAAKATREASGEANRKPTARATREAMAEAAKKLEELAETLAGKETDAARADRLARQQGEAAEKVKRDGKADREGAKARAQALNELRGGAARAEKKAAQEALAQAEKAGPAEQAKAEREAADKLKELADKLANRESAGEKAAQIARAQKELADDTAKGKKGLQDRQADLSWQAGKLGKKADDARKAMDAAGKAMGEKRDATRETREAAKAAEKLARDLGGDLAPKKNERADAGKKGSPLAGKQQAEAARELAREQRELRDAVRRQAQAGQAERQADRAGQPSEKLAKEQAAIANEASKLAKAVKGEQGEKSPVAGKAGKASRATEEASRDLASGALEKAAKKGEAGARALEDLAQALKDTPRGTRPGEADTFEQARKLARRQGELNKQLAPKAGDTSAQRAQQAARQAELEAKTRELSKRLDKLSEQASPQPGAQEAARQGADSARQAREAMRQAREAARQGNQPGAQEARERASQALDRASAKASNASGKGMNEREKPDGQPGKAIAQARGEMGKAGEELGKGKPGDASRSMQSAAEALKRAAESLARSMQPPAPPTERSIPNDTGARPGGAVDDRPGAMAKLPFDPKRWGQLPGELKTKITQEMRSKYGDDYARMIKLYFEQLADTKRK